MGEAQGEQFEQFFEVPSALMGHADSGDRPYDSQEPEAGQERERKSKSKSKRKMTCTSKQLVAVVPIVCRLSVILYTSRPAGKSCTSC